MARVQSDIKAGYYPLDEKHLPHITKLFHEGSQEQKLLDPCAGEGRALEHLSNSLHLTPYANELNQERAEACQTRFGGLHAVQGDLRELRASRKRYSTP